MAKKNFSNNQRRVMTGITVLSFAILSIASLFSTSTGLLGKLVNETFNSLTGQMRYFVPFFLICWSFSLLYLQKRKEIKKIAFFAAIIFLLSIVIVHLSLPVEKQTFIQAIEEGYCGAGGGAIGAFLTFLLLKILGRIGCYIFLVTVVLLLILFFCQKWLKETGEQAKKIFLTWWKQKQKSKEKEKRVAFLENNVEEVVKANLAEEEEITVYQAQEEIVNYQEEEKKEEKQAEKAIVPAPKQPKSNGDYQFPALSLLVTNLKTKTNNNSKELNENIKILEKTLENFGVKAKVVDVQQGPTITRYEMQPPPGVKVSKIVNLTDDLALALAASGVRIEAPVPGKAVVGIEVPNKETSMVCLREIIASDKYQHALSKLTVALGKDIGGNPILADLAKMPHLLIAGTTGSGKSVCVNTLITSILYKAKPEEVKFLLIDPKMVELTSYNGIPHLISPVVTQPRKAASALKWAVQEMEKRYLLFAQSGVRNIEKYNEAGNCLPYIVIVIDELADLMMVAPNDVEDAICRLAQMARAAGLHLVVATQRPSVDVITGVIKSNIASRIAFAVSSQVDSRTILDMGGAEKLLGKGDMLFSPIGALRPVRVQGAFISDKEVEGIVSFLHAQGIPAVEEEITAEEEKNTNLNGEEEDNLFHEAVKVILDCKQASTSLLQRKLRIGYARAARLMDLMEMKGIVGPYEGSKPRAILIKGDSVLDGEGGQ